MGELTRNKLAINYSVKVDEIDKFLNICRYDAELFCGSGARPLWKRLEDIGGVDEIDYNGHFGQYIYLTVEASWDSHGTWIDIFRIIDNFIIEAGEFYAKENKDESKCDCSE